MKGLQGGARVDEEQKEKEYNIHEQRTAGREDVVCLSSSDSCAFQLCLVLVGAQRKLHFTLVYRQELSVHSGQLQKRHQRVYRSKRDLCGGSAQHVHLFCVRVLFYPDAECSARVFLL